MIPWISDINTEFAFEQLKFWLAALIEVFMYFVKTAAEITLICVPFYVLRLVWTMFLQMMLPLMFAVPR